MDPLDIIKLAMRVDKKLSRLDSTISNDYKLINKAFTIDKKIVRAANRAVKEADRKAREEEFLSHVDEYKQDVNDVASKAITRSRFEKDVSGVSKAKVKDASSKIKGLYKRFGSEYIAELILNLSKQYVPVKTGRLRDSGKIEKLDTNKYRIVYGEGLDYAVFVHEIMDNYHIVGRAKFLEDAAYTILNLTQSGDKPLFTFKLKIEGNLVILDIDSIDTDEFMKNEEQRNSLLDINFDDLVVPEYDYSFMLFNNRE